MANLRIYTQVSKRFSHIVGLNRALFYLIQQQHIGIQKVPKNISRNHHDRVSKSTDVLRNLSIMFNGKQNKLFEYINYSNARFNYCFSERFTSFISGGGFFYINLDEYLSLKSKFSRSLYELTCQFNVSRGIDMSISYLKFRIKATDKRYNTFISFINKILLPSIEAVEKNTTIKFKRQEDNPFKVRGDRIELLFDYENKRDLDEKKNSIYESLHHRFKIRPEIAKQAIINLPECYIRELLMDCQYRLSDRINPVRDITAYMTSCLKRQLNLEEKPESFKRSKKSKPKKPSIKTSKPKKQINQKTKLVVDKRNKNPSSIKSLAEKFKAKFKP